MKKKCKVSYALLFLLTTTALICGCQGNPNAAGSQKVNNTKEEEISYLPKPLTFPEYASLDGAYFTGDTLYYAATPFDPNRQQGETAFYTLKPDTTQPELLFTLPAPQRVQKMTMDEAGNLYYLGYEEATQEDSQDTQRIPDFTLYQVDLKGTVLLELHLKEHMKSTGQSDVQGLAVDNKGLYLAVFTANQDIYVFDTKGKLLFETRSASRIYDICSSNEKLWVGYESDKGISFKELDIPNRKLSEKLAHVIPGSQFYLSADHQGGLLVATEESVYQYKVETEELIKKLDWKTFDSTGISAGMLLPYVENGILTISRDYNTFPTKTNLTTFQQATKDEIAAIENLSSEKTVVSLGIPSDLMQGHRTILNEAVDIFNKNHSDIKIEMKTYDPDCVLLNTEIMTGNGPDLLALPSYKIDPLAARGFLEDLNSYFTAEKTLNRSDFLENILNAFEKDGCLYQTPIIFAIDTIVGRTSLLQQKTKWNLEELISFTESLPDKSIAFDNNSKSGVFRLLKHACSSQLVNKGNTAEPLNRDLLIQMLEFSNQYENDDQYIQEEEQLMEKILDHQVVLPNVILHGGQAYFGFSRMFHEPVTFIGYPTSEGSGHLIYSPYACAINSNSKNKDMAWKFICELLSEESQSRIANSIYNRDFPLRKTALEEAFKFHLLRSIACSVHTSDTLTFDLYSYPAGEMKPEDLEPVRDLIQSADMVWQESSEIDRIMEEEAGFYFNNTKSLPEVLDVIENRVRTYVNENN